MNGGEITISVRADYSEMERSLVDAEQKAAQAAEGAAKQYESKFGAWLQRSSGSIQKKFEGFINPIQLLDRVADFAETAGEEGIGTALDNLAKSTPIIGAAYRIGTSIGTALMNAFGAETNEQFAARVEQELADAQKRADAQRKIAQAQEAEARTTFDTAKQAADAEFELAVRNLEREGETRAAIFERGLREEQRLETQMRLEMADADNDAQRDAIRRQYEARIQINADETRDKIEREEKAIADLAAKEEQARLSSEEKERQAAERIAAQKAKEDEEAARRAQKAEEDRLAAQERAFEEATRLEEERISSQAAGITGANTALGTFRFDAYPDADKRRNDDRMVRALESLVSTGGSGGFV
jgi:hypothetical protein